MKVKDEDIQIEGKYAYITFNKDGNKILIVDNNEEILKIIKSNSWYLKNDKYFYSSKLKKYLHQIVISQFYGKDFFANLLKKGYVIDHINNESFDNRISRLQYVIRISNSHKGQRLDRYRKDENEKYLYTLNIYNMYPEEKFSIIICFNGLKIFNEKKEVVSTMEFIYSRKDDDYNIILNDATLMIERLMTKENIKVFFNFADYRFDELKVKYYESIENGKPGQVIKNEDGSFSIVTGLLKNEDGTTLYCQLIESPPEDLR